MLAAKTSLFYSRCNINGCGYGSGGIGELHLGETSLFWDGPRVKRTYYESKSLWNIRHHGVRGFRASEEATLTGFVENLSVAVNIRVALPWMFHYIRQYGACCLPLSEVQEHCQSMWVVGQSKLANEMLVLDAKLKVVTTSAIWWYFFEYGFKIIAPWKVKQYKNYHTVWKPYCKQRSHWETYKYLQIQYFKENNS